MSGIVTIAIGAVSGFIAVAAGAFGAHGLSDLPAKYLSVFKTGAEYQMYHSLALLAVGLMPASRTVQVAGIAFIIGIVIFSGSLYALALTRVDKLGAITPIGGVAFLVGWGSLAWAAISAAQAR